MIQNSNQPKNHDVFYVGLLSFFGGIGQDIFVPVLPLYLTLVLGFDKTFVGTTEGLVSASAAIFAVVGGYFSDKWKKQKSLIFSGYLLSMISRSLLAVITSGLGVVGLRLGDGIGKGVKDPPKDVLVAGDSKKTRGRSFGIVRMLDTLGSVVGPLILFLLLYFFKDNPHVYHYVLIFSAVPLIATLYITAAKLKDYSYVRPNQELEHSNNKLSGKLPKSFFLFLVISLVFTLGNSSDAFLILRAQGVGFSIILIPIVIALFNLVYAGVSVPFGILSDKIGRAPTLLIGWAVYVLTYFGFAYVPHPAMIWVLYALYGVYFGATWGVAKAFLADIVGQEFRGRAFGIYGTTIGVATFFASLIAGFLWDKFGAQAPFYFGAGMAALAALLLVSFSKKLKSVQQEI